MEPSTGHSLYSHNLRGGSEPHLTFVVHSLLLQFFTRLPRTDCKILYGIAHSVLAEF